MFSACQFTHNIPQIVSISLPAENILLSNMSMIYSLRQVVSSYVGPLVRLRRSTDNALSDFFGDSVTGRLDINSVNSWLGAATGFVTTWYNQMGGINASNLTATEQPTIQRTGIIGLVFDGTKKLTVPMSITQATNNGVDGSMLMILSCNNNGCNSFGAMTSGGRWSSHINWTDGACYFDTGVCCQTPRAFTNPNPSVVSQYSFIRTQTFQESRKRGISQVSGAVTGGATASPAFGIGYADGTAGNNHNGNMSEIIFCNTGFTGSTLTALEQDQILYWGV